MVPRGLASHLGLSNIGPTFRLLPPTIGLVLGLFIISGWGTRPRFAVSVGLRFAVGLLSDLKVADHGFTACIDAELFYHGVLWIPPSLPRLNKVDDCSLGCPWSRAEDLRQDFRIVCSSSSSMALHDRVGH